MGFGRDLQGNCIGLAWELRKRINPIYLIAGAVMEKGLENVSSMNYLYGHGAKSANAVRKRAFIPVQNARPM
jgi:hypothetical protein